MVIGAGAAGTLTAARLLQESARRRVPTVVTLVDSRPTTGRGVAYSTSDDRHLLNVPAFKMSAHSESGPHFLEWLESQGHHVEPYTFVPRRRYGEYLAAVLDEAAQRAPMAELWRVPARVCDIEPKPGRCRVTLDTGEAIDATGVVLALGHLGTDTSWAPPALAESPRFVQDPWASGALDAISADDVLIVGTGLTMVDTFMTLTRPGRVVHAISRHGEFPARHADTLLPGMEAPELSASPDLTELRRVMAGHLAKAQARYGDWRPAIDSVRAMTQQLWAGLDDEERAEFLALDARAWDAARHRIPPASAEAVAAARRAGELSTYRARIIAARRDGDGFEVTLSDDRVLRVGAIVNCTGPCDRPERSTDPFVQQLLRRGLVRPGPLGIGFDTAPDGRIVDASGSTALAMWTLGALRKGSLWESTAIPEIRDQAAALGHCLFSARPQVDSRPCDQYGQRLSTTSEAGDAWCQAIDAIRMVQGGAHDALTDAVARDPGFAMGHAALALLGHEWDLPVDITGSLRAAFEAIRMSGDAHERSFVHMARARLTKDREIADRELLRHIEAYPRDCLAVSIALPTIAFSGLAGPVEQSWALVDRLAPAYGDDWWFAGVLGFFRQEQERWREAEQLAARSMAERPGAGHAAHARTHVCYETGAHGEGLAWLDDWIAGHGRDSNHRAHFSWHAALHELALDDCDAARRRYDDQLAPPTVTGARALVDSASLLWRLRILHGELQQLVPTEMFASIDSCVFERPASPFAALHAVVGLAVSRDAEGIHRLGKYATGVDAPTFRDVIAPLCQGFAAVVEERPADAIEPLTRVSSSLALLGGSAAQQEVVTETLLYALVGAGRREAARDILSARLDRRRSPGDRRRLSALV